MGLPILSVEWLYKFTNKLAFISFANFSWAKVMFWSECIYLFINWFVCMHACMLPTFHKNYWTELHKIFRDDLSSSEDQSIRFWE